MSECDECEGGQAEEEDGADTELKTKTPHVNVGNKDGLVPGHVVTSFIEKR